MFNTFRPILKAAVDESVIADEHIYDEPEGTDYPDDIQVDESITTDKHIYEVLEEIVCPDQFEVTYVNFPILNENKDEKDRLNIYSTVDKVQTLLQELQKVCYPNKPKTEKDTHTSAKIFYELGMIYAKQETNKFSLIRAAALFNAAIVRESTHTDQIKESLRELCNLIQDEAGCCSKEDLVEQANEIAIGVKSIRVKARKALKSLQKIPDNLKSEELLQHEKQKVETMREIQNGVTDDYKRIMANLCEFCEKVMGDAPCNYALVGMGSLARKEITPYSDFEHVIILNEGCQRSRIYYKILKYFRWFSVIFHVVIINLGETIIPSVAIPDLNDKTSKMGDWFHHAHTKRGISFDGMLPHACKFPLGRQKATADKPFTTELIKPISEMLEYLNSEESLKQGYHLADILTKTCFVFGDENVYKQFDNAVKQKLRNAYEKECLEDIKVQLKEDLNNFAINTQALTALQSNDTLNVKRLVYRSTTLFISAWGRLEGIDDSSSFDIISALRDKNIISDYQKCKLMYAIALACEIRLRVYLNKDRQDDIYEREARNENDEHSFVDVVGKSSLINYFQIAYALQVGICKKISTEPSHLIADPIMLNIQVYSALGLQQMTNGLLKPNITSTAANVYTYNFEECVTYMEEGLRTTIHTGFCSEANEKNLAYRYSYFSKCLYHMHAFEDSWYYVMRSLKIMESVTEAATIFDASRYELAGCCLLELKKYKQARFYFSKVINCYWWLSPAEAKNTDRRFALVHYYMGLSYKMTNHFSKARKHLHKALTFYEKEPSPDNHVAAIYFHLAVCRINEGDYTLSYMHLKISLQIYKELARCDDFNNEIAEGLQFLVMSYKLKSLELNETNDICDFRITFQEYSQLVDDLYMEKKISLIFMDIGKNLMDLQLLDLSYFWLQKSLTTYTTLPYHLDDDRSYGHILVSIGLCLLKMNKYNQSVKYLTDAQKAYEKTSLEIYADADVAETLRRIGLCFLAMKETSKAHMKLKNALKVYETISVNVETDKNIANVHDDIGVCLMEMHDYEASLECLEKSLHIKKNISLNIFSDDHVALTLNIIGMCSNKLNVLNKSTQYFKQALRIQNRTKTNTFAIICTMNNLGLCLMKTNQLLESVSYFKKASFLCKKVLAHRYSLSQVARRHMADTMNNLGTCHLRMKEYETAHDAFGDALEYYSSLSSNAETEEFVFYVRNNIGLCFMRLRNYDYALVYFKQSLDAYECKVSVHRNANPSGSYDDTTILSIAALHNNIGLCLLHTNCANDSIPYFEKSVALYQKLALNNNCDVVAVFRNIAIAHMNKGCYSDDCFRYLNNALILSQETSTEPDADENIAELLFLMGTFKKQMNLFEEALSYFEDALAIMRRVSRNEADDERVLRTLYGCGLCLTKLGRHESLSIQNTYLEMTLKCINHWQYKLSNNRDYENL